MMANESRKHDPAGALRNESRLRFHDLWSRIKSGDTGQIVDPEEKRLAEIMLEHPEYHDQFETADRLTGHEFDPGAEVNPFLHITLHGVIENQLAAREPIEAYRFYNEMLRKGADRHEALHLIAGILTPLMFDVLQHNREFDDNFYKLLLRRLKDKKPGKIAGALEEEFARYFDARENDEPRSSPRRLTPQLAERIDQALALADDGHIRDAGRIIARLYKKHAGTALVQYAMGVIMLLKEQYREAIPYFDTATELDPLLVEAWYNRGAACKQLLDTGGMIVAFQKVIEIGDPGEPFVEKARDIVGQFGKSLEKDGMTIADYLKGREMFDKAFAAMRRKDWEEALAGFREVLKLNPRHVQSYGNIGICHGFLGRREEALAALDKALELDAGYEPAQINRELVASLKEGEALDIKMASTDYYLQRVLGKRHQSS